MYEYGWGAARDYVYAHMWYNIVAASGNEYPGEYAGIDRDNIASRMTPAQIAEAQNLSRQCQQSAFKNCGGPTSQVPLGQVPAGQQGAVTMVEEGGVFAVPVLINDTITLNFIVDSGASGVSIPEDVVSTLMRSGTITDADFTGTQTFVLADGSTTTKPTFNIRTLKVGDITLENIEGSVADAQGPLLLGQSFLGRFNSWSINNSNHTLVLE